MKLIDDWRRLAPRLWSVRLALLSAVLSAAEVVVQLLTPEKPTFKFALLAGLVALAAGVARVVAQPRATGRRGGRQRGRSRPAVLALAVALAIPAEGLRRVAYYDPPGILTVCYGSTRDVQPGKVYSLAECRGRLDADMQAAVATVERCAPGLPDHPAAAFADAVYNMGPTIVCDPRNSTAARLLRAGDVAGACDQLPRWDKARIAGVLVPLPGLTKRRAAERELCLSGLV